MGQAGWRAAGVALVFLMLGLAACESRPPIDVSGHKNSTWKDMTIGLPF